MKNSANIYAFFALACIVLLVTVPLLAKEWSASQKEVLSSFNKYLATVQQGNIKAIVGYWHPKYVGWNYGQEIPTNYDASLKGVEEFNKNYKFKKMECNPLEIQVEGDIAILHVHFSIVIIDSAGKEVSSSGPETIILVKKDQKWAMLGLVWIEK
jgi:ketosteroid isomerase-like protein